jgi:FkbM family methyltransferase
MKVVKQIINLVINKPAFLVNDKTYFKYIIFISRLLSKFQLCLPLDFKYVTSTVNKKIIIELNGTNPDIWIQSHYRVSRFLKGFKYAGLRQWNRYKLFLLLNNQIPDIFIDIGANIGELSYFAHTLGIKQIIAVEPDPFINNILKFNLRDTNISFDTRVIGNSDKIVNFYLSPDTADSSMIKPAKNANTIEVQSVRLKTFLSTLDSSLTILVKMDAEGFEPEILKSGEGALNKIKFFAVDVSPERQGKTTKIEVIKLLKKNNFKIFTEDNNVVTAVRIN